MCFFLLETIQWPPPILHQKYKKQIDSEVHLFISTESSEFSCRKPVFFTVVRSWLFCASQWLIEVYLAAASDGISILTVPLMISNSGSCQVFFNIFVGFSTHRLTYGTFFVVTVTCYTLRLKACLSYQKMKTSQLSLVGRGASQHAFTKRVFPKIMVPPNHPF